MYLEIFLADFAVFRVFWGISRDFAGMPEFRGSATARNIRSPDYYSSYTCITNNNTMKVNMIFVVHHGLFILLWRSCSVSYLYPEFKISFIFHIVQIITILFTTVPYLTVIQFSIIVNISIIKYHLYLSFSHPLPSLSKKIIIITSNTCNFKSLQMHLFGNRSF